MQGKHRVGICLTDTPIRVTFSPSREPSSARAALARLLGVICVVIGVFFTVTVVLAIAGIPAVLFGWWCWRFGSKNVAAVEAGYSEYVGALA
jgi:hypothetical protein